jgi:catechol 2,3-dioxygenase-like lactoylglutathione lyase family enzyme
MSNRPFNVLHLDHIVLRTTNVPRLRRFYEQLGCSVVRDTGPEAGLVQLRLGASMLDLVDVAGRIGRLGDSGAPPGQDGRNVDHFAVRIEPFDKERILAFCEAHGIKARAMPEPLLGADGYGPAVYITDPDGNRLELKGPPIQTAAE